MDAPTRDPLDEYRAAALRVRMAMRGFVAAVDDMAAAANAWDPQGRHGDAEAETLVADAVADLGSLVRRRPCTLELLRGAVAGLRRLDEPPPEEERPLPGVGEVGGVPA